MHPWVRRCSLIALFACVRGLAVRAQVTSSVVPAPATGTIVGSVVSKDGGQPLGYSVVSIETLGRERFTTETGQFTLVDLPVGEVRVRIRHLGYTPMELSIAVRAGATDTVKAELTRIAVRLVTVQVRGYPECKDPGPPNSTNDSSFATVFGQLHQNAEQYRLLTHEYPFNVAIERTIATMRADGQLTMDITDTLGIRSVDEWQYKPGDMLSVEKSRFRFMSNSLVLNLPTLTAFADPLFLANHCFQNGGLETLDGHEYLRIDFVAASTLRDPDVDGSMYLDPVNFQIRRSFLHLSKIPRAVRGLAEVEVTTIFGEVFPSVPLIAAVSSVNEFVHSDRRSDAPTRTIEEQRLIRVNFLKSRPGDDAKKSPQ